MTRIADLGLSIDVPRGWDASIGRREDGLALLHLANFALPEGRGDYGGGAVELMGSGGIFISLLEFDRGSARTAAFSRPGIPRGAHASWFDPDTLQRPQRGQSGFQVFCNEAGRAFCLYVVLGSHRMRSMSVREVNRALSGLALAVGA